MATKEKDSTISLVVHGSTPSKKNSRIGVVYKGRVMNFPNKKYVAWHKESLQSLKNAPRIDGNVKAVHLSIWGENKRKFDLSNKAESVMDLLVDAKVIGDDNYEVVPELCLTYGGIDKENPRCEITIYVI